MNRAALRYAKAALNLAKEANNTKEINNDMLLISSTVDGSTELQAFLNNPISKSDDKLKVINGLFGDKINSITNGIIKLLVVNKRLNLLPFVAKQYAMLFDKEQGVDVAKVITAIPLTEELKTKVLAKVKAVTNKEAVLENIIDESIIGGFILQIGDKQYDASISGKLGNLRRNFEKNDYKVKM
jgi:F-type H+-transporting ATPase subunit delta